VGRWDETYFHQIGLEDLVEENYSRIGQRVRPIGEPIGTGLSDRAAQELGLQPGTAVSVSIIDAHAGGIGLIGTPVDGKSATSETLDTRLALIGGTSSCHMAVSPEARFVPGVWGPYYSAMIPQMWLTEGGQSASGALIDHMIDVHAQGPALKQQAEQNGTSIYTILNERIEALASDCEFPEQLTRDVHVYPDFHGNRSPLADPTLRGMISGLTLGESLDDLAVQYYATVQAVAHGTKHIIDTLNEHGYRIETIIATGGGTKNPFYLRAHADITGCSLVLPEEGEAVLLGSAILGAVAAGHFASITDGMAAMSQGGEALQPQGGQIAAYHAQKHKVHLKMLEDQRTYRNLVQY
jgi:FGGY-family pentulose kinase